jgi:hypothetical protein
VGSNSPDSATVYYDDGTIIVSGKMITLGSPYNQTYNLATIVGVAHGNDNTGKSVKVFWIILAVFGIFFGLSDWRNSIILGSTIIAGSVAILAKMIQGLERSYVELKFGGLNNQMLFMKRMEQAEHLAASINMAIQDMHTPPKPGQPVQSAPIFPSPVFSRN